MKISRQKVFSSFLILLLLTMTLTSNLVFAYDVVGDPQAPSLTINKFEQNPGESQTDGSGLPGESPVGTPLEGVEFTLTQTHSYNPAIGEWTEVTDASPIVGVTNQDGQLVLTQAEGLELGRYSVLETDGPPHVNLNTTEYFVDIPMTSTDGNILNYSPVIYPKNETIYGAVELFKTDGDTGNPLAGVTFELYDSNDTLLNTLTTDENGYIRVDGLKYGDYYFKEISAPGDYVVFGTPVNFSITESGTIDSNGNSTGTVVPISIENHIAPDIEKTINGSKDLHETNRETEFTYNLTIALPEDITEYQNFVVTDELDSRLFFTGTWTVEGIDSSILTFEQNGQVLTWTVNDFAALDGIEFFTINFNAEINQDTEVEIIPNTGEIDFTNGSDTDGNKETKPVNVTPTEGTLSIIKQDGTTNERLSGAVFELRDAGGNVVSTKTSDSNGELRWSGLDYGDYQLVEITAPGGYRLLENPIDITIDGGNVNVSITVDNYQSGWELPQTGGIGSTMFTIVGLTLMGIAFVLYMRHIRRRKLTE